MKSDLLYLEHIIDRAAAVQRYFAAGKDGFMRERMVQDAVIRNFEIIGEAAGHLSLERESSAPQLSRKIIAFRNRLSHVYRGIDLLLVSDVVQNDLGALKAEAERRLGDLGSET